MEMELPVCRICLNTADKYIDLQTRFECCDDPESITNDMNYFQCLRLCTNLPIDFDEEPRSLCTECEAELQVVYKFLQKAQHSYAILKGIWHDSNKETIVHTEISIEKCEPNDNVDDSDPERLPDLSQEINVESEENNVIEENIYIVYDVSEVKEDLSENEKNENVPNETTNSEESSVQTYHPNKYMCSICNRSYSNERLLKCHLYYHKRRSMEINPYSCKICGESFSLQRYLTKHMLEHEDFCETHKCEECDKEYTTKTALISHKRIHQGEAFKCTECGKELNGSYEFRVHLRFHKREKEQGIYTCEICKKQFTLARFLSQHMMVHRKNKKSYKCIYCNREYLSKTALNHHKCLQKRQTTKCNECGKEFTGNCELKMHMRFHRNEYPFQCTMCDKKFTIESQLTTHMRQHQSNKLECQDCGKLFESMNELNEHSCSYGNVLYSCEYCDKAYPSIQTYKIHLEKVHCTDGNDFDLTYISTRKEPEAN